MYKEFCTTSARLGLVFCHLTPWSRHKPEKRQPLSYSYNLHTGGLPDYKLGWSNPRGPSLNNKSPLPTILPLSIECLAPKIGQPAAACQPRTSGFSTVWEALTALHMHLPSTSDITLNPKQPIPCAHKYFGHWRLEHAFAELLSLLEQPEGSKKEAQQQRFVRFATLVTLVSSLAAKRIPRFLPMCFMLRLRGCASCGLPSVLEMLWKTGTRCFMPSSTRPLSSH